MKSLSSGIRVASLAFILAGCAPRSVTPFSTTNPANPNATESAYPAAVSVLVSGTNYALKPQAEPHMAPHQSGTGRDMEHGNPMQHQEHGPHQMTPEQAP